MRRLLAACAAAGLALLLVVAPGVSPAAQAASFAPGVPGPVNVVSSVLAGSGANYTGTRFAGYVASVLGGFIKDGTFFKAAAAQAAGVATPVESGLVAATKTGFRLPAIPAGVLLKTVGTAGAALTAFDVGGMVGNGVVNLVGVDAEGSVCAAQSEVLAFLSHVDCTAWKASAALVPNVGQFAGYSAQVCTTPGNCWGLSGKAVVSNYSNYYSVAANYCLVKTGAPSGSAQILFHFDAAGRAAWSPSTAASFMTAGQSGGPVDALVGSPVAVPFGPSGSVTAAMCPSGYGTPVANLYSSGLTYFTAAQANSFVVPVPSGISWNTAGSPVVATTVSDGNPSRVLRCQVTLTTGAQFTTDTLPFKETDGQFPAPDCPQFPAAVPLRNITIWEVGGGETLELYNKDTTPEYQSSATNYPECMSGTCMLDLQALSSGSAVSCFSSPDGCSGWFADPNKSTDYRCTYGTHTVALSECNLYAPTFKPGATATSSAYGDPTTGDPLPGSSPSSALQPGTAVADPAQSRDCFPSGWAAFNPVEWILKPVGCALQWAFVPRVSAVDEATTGTKTAWEGSTPGKLAQALLVFSFVAPSSGCQGLAVPVPTPDAHGHVQLVNKYFLPACTGDFFAPWAPLFSVFIGGAACITGFFGAARHLGGIFGYGSLGGDS